MYNYLRKKQWFWDLVKKLVFLYPDSSFEKNPKEIIVELTNSCNLRCSVCPTHFDMKRKKGLMDFRLFKSVIDEFKPYKKKPIISFSFAGEPLINKNAPKFVEYAEKNGHKTFVSTNVSFLTKDMSKKLIKAGLSDIHLCIDGFTKKAHEAYRIRSKFEVVKKNIENFIKKKKQLKSKMPFISIQTLLTSYTESQMEEIKKWTKKIGADEIAFKSFSIGSYTSKEMKKKYSYLLPKNKKLRRKTLNVYKTICRSPVYHPVLFWNGDIGLCCIDFDNKLGLPNIKEKGFLNTFKSKRVVNIRKSAFLKKHGICKKCQIGNADFMGINIKLR